MSRPAGVPKLTHHKASGRAVVRLNGHDHYLGTFGTAEAQAAYDRLIREWLARGRRPELTASAASQPAPGPTVSEVILAFWAHAQTHYRDPDGNPTTEVKEYRYSLRPVRELYGSTPAESFGPLALKAVRRKMVEAGLSRGVVNQRVGRVKRVFKWAVENERVPPSLYHGLAAVKGLQKGRTEAPEPEPVGPVDPAHVEAVLPLVRPPVRAMIRVQRLAGMRPQDVCRLRLADVDRAAELWVYRPPAHKTTHKGKVRVIPLGPRARAVIGEFLAGVEYDPEAAVFSPARDREERSRERRANRKTRVQPSQVYRRKASPERVPAAQYTTHAYAHAVAVACGKAGIPRWHPNQLRHSFGTEVRKSHGLEAAQVLLGHSRADVTQVYAERDLALALKVAAEIG